MTQARVYSIEALTDVQAAFAKFTDQAREAVTCVDMEVRRTLEWLNDQSDYWRTTVRQCEDEVFQAKNELDRKKILATPEMPVDTSEEEKNLRRARERLDYAQERVANTRRWLRLLPEAIDEYRAASGQLSAALDADMPKINALLESKIVALEEYTQLPASSDPPEKT